MHLYSAFILYCSTPKALYNHVVGGVSYTTTSVQYPLTLPQDNGASALTTHQLEVEKSDRANQVDGGY